MKYQLPIILELNLINPNLTVSMKKILLLFVILSLFFSLSACFKKAGSDLSKDSKDTEIDGVSETGLVLDISEMNDKTATVTPGDVLYFKLEGEADSGKQWSVVGPTSGDYLMLKDHKVVGLNNPEIEGGKFTDEWWLKIEDTGIFDLEFEYGLPNQEAEEFFSFKVISQ